MKVPAGHVWFLGGRRWCRRMLVIWAIRNRFGHPELTLELR